MTKTSVDIAFLSQPLPSTCLCVTDNSGHLLFICFTVFLDAFWVWTSNAVDVSLCDTHLPEIFQARPTKDVLA
jgi:hypothetical protein